MVCSGPACTSGSSLGLAAPVGGKGPSEAAAGHLSPHSALTLKASFVCEQEHLLFTFSLLCFAHSRVPWPIAALTTQ